MVLKCSVKFLDGTYAEFEVEKGAKGSVLFDDVCKYTNILERHYFGLVCKRSNLQHCWLNLEKKIRKQVNKLWTQLSRKDKLEFEFAVKFYPSDPTLLKEGITRYQICLQIREDLRNDLEASIDKLANLICFWLKSDYKGIEITSEAVTNCLKEFGSTNSAELRAEFIDRVLTLCKSSSDISSADADERFLLTAASLRLYGVHFYKGKESSGNDILIGISSKGVTEKRRDQLPVLHTWSRIKNIVHKKSKFKIKLIKAPVNGDPRLKKSFIFDSEEQVQLIWKNAVDHHVFFRVGAKDPGKRVKKKGSILRRLSSKKKLPKTESEAQEESEGITRQQPVVIRVNSIRLDTTPKPTPPEEISIENERDTEALKSDNVLETIPKSTASYLLAPQLPPIIVSRDLMTPSEGNDVHTVVDNTTPETANEEEREYADDDIADIILLDASAGGGSSTLLFKETIVEEEEEEEDDPVYATSHKTVDNDSGQMAYDYGEFVDSDTEKELREDEIQPSVEEDPPEFTGDMNQYSEEWTDLPATIVPTTKKDVRFLTNDTVSDDEEDESSLEIPGTVNCYDERFIIPANQTLDNMSDSEDAASDDTIRLLEVDSHPLRTGQAASADKDLLTINEYVPKARKDSTEESDIEEDYDTPDTNNEEDCDSPDTVDAIHVGHESNAKDTCNISAPHIHVALTETDDEQKSPDIDKPPTVDTVGHKTDSVEDSNESTNAKSSHSSPLLSGKKEPVYRKSARSLGIDFRVGDAYKPINSGKGPERVIDGAASTTAATIGDEDDLSMQELDEDILYGHDYSNSEENDEDDAKASDHSDDDTDRSASHEDLLRQGVLHTTDQSFKDVDLLGSKSPDRNHDGAASTTAATIGDDDVLSLAESDSDIIDEEVPAKIPDKCDLSEPAVKEDGTKQEFMTTKSDSDSRYSSLSNVSGDTDELLDTDALEKAWSQGAQLDEEDELFRVLFRSPPKRKPRNKSEINVTDVKRGRQQAMAFRSSIDEEPISPRRRENLAKRPFIPSWPFDPLAILCSRDLDDLEQDALEAAIAAQMYLLDGEKRLEEMEMMGHDIPTMDDDMDDNMMMSSPQVFTAAKPCNFYLTEKIHVRSRSPSPSPRMVGEEFIPGVPDFVHSVVPHQLPTPACDANHGTLEEVGRNNDPYSQESAICAPKTAFEETCDGENSAAEDTVLGPDNVAIADDEKNETEVDKSVLSDAGPPTASSGRSTPSGSNSLSEGTSSSNSKSSRSSFPRFVHSVFPLRRTPEQRRGRSKTRRKREKKITKQKNKKVARSKSRDKKGPKNVTAIEMTSAPQVEGFKAFPILPSHPVCSESLHSPMGGSTGKLQSDSLNTTRRLYDQESLDKITLSDSDDAHSKPKSANAASGEPLCY